MAFWIAARSAHGWTEFATAAAASLITISGTLLAFWLGKAVELHRLRTQLAAALSGEMYGICDLLKERQYATRLNSCLEASRENAQLFLPTFVLTEDLFRVYTSNSANIGLLPKGTAFEVARWYTRMRIVLEDLKRLETATAKQWDVEKTYPFLTDTLKWLADTQFLGPSIATRLYKSSRRPFWAHLFRPDWHPVLTDEEVNRIYSGKP